MPEIRGEIDVHVRDHAGVAVHPGATQRPAASPIRKTQDIDAGKRRRKPARDTVGGIDAAVVSDDDARVNVLHAREMAAQRAHALREHALLVEHRQHDVDTRWGAPQVSRRSHCSPARRGHTA